MQSHLTYITCFFILLVRSLLERRNDLGSQPIILLHRSIQQVLHYLTKALLTGSFRSGIKMFWCFHNYCHLWEPLIKVLSESMLKTRSKKNTKNSMPSNKNNQQTSHIVIRAHQNDLNSYPTKPDLDKCIELRCRIY